MESKQDKIQNFAIELNFLVYPISLFFKVYSHHFEMTNTVLFAWKVWTSLVVIIFVFCVVVFCWYIVNRKKKEQKNKGFMWLYLILDSIGIFYAVYYLTNKNIISGW